MHCSVNLNEQFERRESESEAWHVKPSRMFF